MQDFVGVGLDVDDVDPDVVFVGLGVAVDDLAVGDGAALLLVPEVVPDVGFVAVDVDAAGFGLVAVVRFFVSAAVGAPGLAGGM